MKLDKNVWSKVDKDGISFEDRLLEPLLVHVEEYMSGSDSEIVIDEIKSVVNKVLAQEIQTAVQKEREKFEENLNKLEEKYLQHQISLENYYYKKHPNKGKLARVICKNGNYDEILMVNKYIDSPDGIYIEIAELPTTTKTQEEL